VSRRPGWDTGVPILSGSRASFECETYAVHDGGDHLIFIGRVRQVRFEPLRDPLLYFRGKYRRLHFQ
jgi:flavin reductase (DIM6/NTAB) family NADH-FMN oxidoreductase RutF